MFYVNEDTMDCFYDSNTSNISTFSLPKMSILQEEPASPDLFESDEADDENESITTCSTYPSSLPVTQTSPKKDLTQEELVLKADNYILRRANKFLGGIPPPPHYTICQKDCDDFLVNIRQNRQYFWADPFREVSASDSGVDQNKTQDSGVNINHKSSQSKSGLRNLSLAFDACELEVSNPSTVDSGNVDMDTSDTTSSLSISDTINISLSTSGNTDTALDDSSCKDNYQWKPSMYYSIVEKEASLLSWPEACKHKYHDICYNRNKAAEEFENIRLKLCERYIGAETQSTCNIWFSKQAPGSARKRQLLLKRISGQSPYKRLSHLARRRSTFSSANLQSLAAEKNKRKPLMVTVRNFRKVIQKGKSPRGKTPKGKSPRGSAKKTPRSSAKKRNFRKAFLERARDGSKRALFQSPNADKAGTSKTTVSMAKLTINNPQKAKKKLFPTPKKQDGIAMQNTTTESRKRKSDEELSNPKTKWAKSLSFDCNRVAGNNSTNGKTLERHSTCHAIVNRDKPNLDKCEISDTNRKKLLWAVAEALKGKGIDMKHPNFRHCASSLISTVRKMMPELENKGIPKKQGSTTERMLKLAKQYVILVTDKVKTAV